MRSPAWIAPRFAAPAAAAIGWLVAVLATRNAAGLTVPDASLLLAWTAWACLALLTALRGSPRAPGPTGLGAVAVTALVGAVLAVMGSPRAALVPAAGALLQLALAAKRPRAAFAALAFGAAMASGLGEGSLYALRHVPKLASSAALRPLARNLYRLDLNIIQYLPECARWDPELGYTLKPGQCVFENTEYRTAYRINRLGLRDSEEALDGPEIIALGDSLTMGWGVEQDEAFPQRLARMTGKKVLNAGVSSYAAVRELRMLERIDRSRAGVLLLQYSSNDFGENRDFGGARGDLPVRSREQYEQAVAGRADVVVYRFPRYSYRLYEDLLAKPLIRALHSFGWPPPGFKEPSFGHNPDWRTPQGRRREVEAFLNALRGARLDLSPYRVILFQLDEPGEYSRWFLPLLSETLHSAEPSERPPNLEILDIGAKLTRDDFFDLDFHLTAEGHAKVARLLAEALEAR